MNKLVSIIISSTKREERTTTIKTTRAFTLLEMLLVIAIIAILAGIVIVAINPGRQLAQARNAQRASDLRALNSAVQQYYIDNRAWPAGLDQVNTLTEICNTGAEGVTHSVNCAAEGLIDLSILVPTYISAIPADPQVTASLPFTNTAHAQTTNGAGYQIAIISSNQSIALLAPNSEEYGLTQVSIGNIEEVTTYTVNFNNQGGTPETNTISDIPYNTTVTLPSEPTREGFTFSSWYTEQNGQGTQFTDATPITQTITVYANWNAEDYLLTYDANGGQDAPNSENRQYQNDDPLSPDEPTRTGYTFLHWNTESNGSGTSYNPGDSFMMPASNETLYAIWSINQYTLTFNTDGGSSISPITQDYNTAITAPADPTKSGYTFNGWSPTIPATMPANNQTHIALWNAVVTWACGDSLVDERDGQSYNTVEIGTQCWMQENLNVGTMISGSLNQGTSGDPASIQKYCWGNLEANCTADGGLYQWGQTMAGSITPGARGICPTGWHVPTHTEFTMLERSICELLGNPNCNTTFPDDNTTKTWLGTTEGTYMKNMSEDWKALLAGGRNTNGSFLNRGTYTYFWSSVEDGTSAWSRLLYSSTAQVHRSTFDKRFGFSVRCLKN